MIDDAMSLHSIVMLQKNLNTLCVTTLLVTTICVITFFCSIDLMGDDGLWVREEAVHGEEALK